MASNESQPDLKKPKALGMGKSADWWLQEIARSQKSWSTYRERAHKVIERFRDERDSAMMTIQGKRFNMLYSNTETLRAAIYSRVPNPDVRRRFLDRDPVGRVAAEVLQRSLAYATDAYDCDAVLSACNEDFVLPGFAVAWVRYRPYFATQDGIETLAYQEVADEYVSWDAFTMSRSRQWERVWWVAKYEDLSREEIETTFGKAMAEKVKMTRGADGATLKEGNQADDELKSARVWEVWCKRDRSRLFVAEGNDFYVRAPEADPLKLEAFFPCPRPLWAISTTSTMVPVPEYLMYQDQALELDDLTERIDVLTSALRRRGVYDAENQDTLQSLASSATDNDFKPVKNWQALMDKGGLSNIIAELPIEGLAKIIVMLYEARDRTKQVIYEVTGIADIVRGQSDPRETLGAQKIKGQWAGMRVNTRRDKFAKFARDLLRLKAEIIAEKFRPEEFEQMSGIKLFGTVQEKQQMQQAAQMAQQQGQPVPPEIAEKLKQPTWEEVTAILRNDKLRGFRIDIETDSTVQPNADEEKQRRVELITGITGFLGQAGPLVAQGVMPAGLAKELLQFTVRGFQVGSQVEQALDELGANEGEDPKIAQAKQAMQAKEQELQQREAQVKEQEHGAQLASKDAQIQSERLKGQQKDLDHKAEIMALEQRMRAELDAFKEQLEHEVESAINEAKMTARGAIEKASGEKESATLARIEALEKRMDPNEAAEPAEPMMEPPIMGTL